MNLTRKQILDLESVRSQPPSRFTGVWKGQQYYKGRPWYGPTNLVGASHLRRHKSAYETPEPTHAQVLQNLLGAAQ